MDVGSTPQHANMSVLTMNGLNIPGDHWQLSPPVGLASPELLQSQIAQDTSLQHGKPPRQHLAQCQVLGDKGMQIPGFQEPLLSFSPHVCDGGLLSYSPNTASSPLGASLLQSEEQSYGSLDAQSSLLIPVRGTTSFSFGGNSHAAHASSPYRGVLSASSDNALRQQEFLDSQQTVSEFTYSVEDLLRCIGNLSPNERVVNVVAPALRHLDSSALAALMKELGRQNMAKRAVELFDFLRRDAGPDHTHLLDIYTYTTAISVCSASQQLQRALELVAEMRSRGISCNVHTYSALMNVCIKSNEVQLAQEVYGQMIQEGCTPNLVTYNTLIDLYVKTGQWQEAIKVLDTLEEEVSSM